MMYMKNIIKYGTKIRKCRHGKATYIFVKSDTPDQPMEGSGVFYGPCINCVSCYTIPGIKVPTYRPYMCNYCNPTNSKYRGNWQLYSTGRLSREKIVYKEK